jgi:hypothetical protein
MGRSAVTDNVILDDDISRERVPVHPVLVRAFVNPLDHELQTDELTTTEGLTTFLVRHRLLADVEHRERRVLGRVARCTPRPAAVGGDGVVAASADDGVTGALALIGLAGRKCG